MIIVIVFSTFHWVQINTNLSFANTKELIFRFDRKDSVTDKLSTLKWKTLESRRIISRLSMLYKTLYRLVSHEDAKLQSAGHSNSIRSVEYCTLTMAIRDYYEYSFYPRTIAEWNKLPRDMALSNSLAAFKNAISNIY